MFLVQLPIARNKKLPMHFNSVRRLENDLLRGYKLLGRETRWQCGNRYYEGNQLTKLRIWHRAGCLIIRFGIERHGQLTSPNRGRIFGIRTEIEKIVLVREQDGAPLNSFASALLGGCARDNIDGPQVSPINVAAIRIEKHRLVIRREGPLFDFTIARREESRLSATRRQ